MFALSLATILFISLLLILHRLATTGVNFGRFSLFSWSRRNRYRLPLDSEPLFNLPSPSDAATVCLVAVACADGQLSVNQRRHLLDVFQHNFQHKPSSAKAHLEACLYMLGDGKLLMKDPKRVIEHSCHRFSTAQIKELHRLLITTAHIDGEPTSMQKTLCKKISNALPLASAIYK